MLPPQLNIRDTESLEARPLFLSNEVASPHGERLLAT
jgi:hypothetical protein